MTFPHDTTPLFDAVVHALTAPTGMPRCLPDDRLYQLGRPQDLAIAPSPGKVLTPRCFVAPITEKPMDAQLVMTTRGRVEATVEIRCWYYASELHSDAWRETMARIADDRKRVGEALTYPGNLYTAPDGRRTGLDGGSLSAARWEPAGPVPERGQPRVYLVTHTFRAGVELTRVPTT